MFYINHEDNFSGEQFGQNSDNIANQLFYQEIEKKSHCSIRLTFFRTFFENIP